MENKTQNKICVYAICKNEKKFVDRWLSSMKEADYVVVLDTGSDDGTYEALKNDTRVTRVEQKKIIPWRFDVARNESMKLAPDDANILISTDLDEVLHPGWAKVIRERWIDGFHTRGGYKFIWSHTPSGEPGRVFGYNKMHDRNWEWRYPVHEMLVDKRHHDKDYVLKHTLNLWDKVTQEHFPDMTKSRASYLPLLEQRAEEDPEDYYGLFYLSNEYSYRGMHEKSIDVLKKLLDKFSSRFTTTEVAAAYLFLGDNYRKTNDRQKAIYYYNLGIQAEPTYRECYLNAAEIYNELQMYEVAVAYVETALKKSYRHYVWVERDISYSRQPHDILSVSEYYIALSKTNEVEKNDMLSCALGHVEIALKYSPNDERIIKNREYILGKLS